MSLLCDLFRGILIAHIFIDMEIQYRLLYSTWIVKFDNGDCLVHWDFSQWSVNQLIEFLLALVIWGFDFLHSPVIALVTVLPIVSTLALPDSPRDLQKAIDAGLMAEWNVIAGLQQSITCSLPRIHIVQTWIMSKTENKPWNINMTIYIVKVFWTFKAAQNLILNAKIFSLLIDSGKACQHLTDGLLRSLKIPSEIYLGASNPIGGKRWSKVKSSLGFSICTICSR